MTNTCMCKRGFFVLRDCGQIAERACERCARPTCHEHLSPRLGMRVCVECAAREIEGRPDDLYDNDWLYSYRRQYYTRDDYSPIYLGPSPGSYYDDYDFRSFDSTAEGEPVEGDFGGAGAGGDFFES